MENDEILNQIESGKSEEHDVEVKEESFYRYLVFWIGDQKFALPAEDVQEILTYNEIYFVPFVPPYIRGYANRHGQPYTVFDLLMLFENNGIEGSHLLILKVPDDQIALLISDVDEIVKVPDSKIYSLTSHDETSQYFSGAINVEETEIFILGVAKILERLELDIERS
ncbi:MAG: chemotaxis protein CheW [Spirochaetales bacterium]|nr:chemotaxis protein CheW [Spirochaetales bacterium]MCF7938503.1 chemotaxis protein CheW [Spirochaetales bacterium]